MSAVADAKREVIERIANGATLKDAMGSVGRSVRTYSTWRFYDKDFAAECDRVREGLAMARSKGFTAECYTLSFAEWRKRYLGQDTYRHQQAWIDVIEGKKYEPVPGETYIPANRKRVIINVPPFHAKSMTLTIEYVTYRICMNPNIRVVIVSKTGTQAQKFLYAIKQRLTSGAYAAMHAAYAPPGGFRPDREDGATWGAAKFYVRGADSGEKDPTVEAIGIRGMIYGNRADLVILDDCVTTVNAGEYEAQINWVESELENRVRDGLILFVGTRLAPTDLYKELPNGSRYLSGRSPWTVLRQKAVLEYRDDPKDWVTLWPKSSAPLEIGQQPEKGGLYEAWGGPRMAEERDKKPPRVWSLVYQQEDVAEDATFNPVCVMGSVDRRRKPGPLTAGAWGHPRNGLEGMYVVASLDPAMSGDTFCVVGAVDRVERKRYIMNAWVENAPSPAKIRSMIREVTEKYRVNEWVIEQNAFQLFLVHDEEISRYCQNRGVIITPHYTSRNKLDPDFGVASVATLFGSFRRHVDGGRAVHNGDNLISLPDPDYSSGIKALIEQLMAWQPGKRGKDLRQDGPMALWFFELRARSRVLGDGNKHAPSTHRRNTYATRGDLRRRVVVPLTSMGSSWTR